MNVDASTTCITRHENATDNRSSCWRNPLLWKTAKKYVNRIQTRIAKAVKEGKKNLVKRLQYLLSHSFFAKVLAVNKVTTNKGKHTCGVDGVVWKTDKQKLHQANKLNVGEYKTLPLRRVYIEKYGKKEKRPLGIPTMQDRAMQALYLQGLEPIAETTADKTSFGFRRFRSTKDAMAYIFCLMSRRNSPQWVLEADIKKCFDKIDHKWLLENIPMDKKILEKFLKAGYVFKGDVYATDLGTPQGGLISATLANMTLDGLEEVVHSLIAKTRNGKTCVRDKSMKKLHLVRYADDFIVTAATEEIALAVKHAIQEFLQIRGLSLSEEKTHITNIKDGFDFLSWNFRKYHGKLIIKPSKKAIRKISEKLMTTIGYHKASAQTTLIQALNPIIHGWANQHQAVCAKETFGTLDHLIFDRLWQWAKRRHPNKSKNWIKQRYWKKVGTREWVFTADGVTLVNFADKPIVRHPQINLEKHTFLDSNYFEQRKIEIRKKKVTAFLKTAAARQ